MTDVYVVTYGEGRKMKGVHGVFGEKHRAEVATEELQRVYDEPRDWVEVEAHEFVTAGVADTDTTDDA